MSEREFWHLMCHSLKQIAQADDHATVRRVLLRIASAIEQRHLTDEPPQN